MIKFIQIYLQIPYLYLKSYTLNIKNTKYKKKLFEYKSTFQKNKSVLYNPQPSEDFMKRKHTFLLDKDNNLEDFKAKHNYQIMEEYWKKRKKECEKNLSKFC